ncbi:MAG: 30S ribosomal protein S17 [Candidatus Hydrogenedentota bacterium]|nr:MAG: 30S ribosomal protein S17 [Candidatus Hydrogenedentota bacterium]
MTISERGEKRSAGRRKEFVGVVKSAAMEKSIVVDIVTPRPDPLYRKYVKKTKRIMAHDERSEAKPGDTVRVVECRPLSKRKRWRLVQVIERAKAIGREETP